MLPREMVRQAVLIAARDQLGASTRDEVIEAIPAGPTEGESGKVEVVSFIRDNRSQELVRRVRTDGTETLFAHETPTAAGSSLDLLELLKTAEVLSREQFPAVLTGLGLEGKQNTFNAEAGLPQKVEARLRQPGFPRRALGGARPARGDQSRRRVARTAGGAARGYALLGILSEFQWQPAHRAFKARALLYAQRMIARQPSGPTGLRHRAFVLAHHRPAPRCAGGP